MNAPSIFDTAEDFAAEDAALTHGVLDTIDQDELHGYAEPVTTEEVERLLARIANKRAEAKRVGESAARMVAAASAEADWLTARAAPALEAYAKADPNIRTGKRKSVPLLNGTLGFRLKPESIAFDKAKEAEAVAWAKENAPECVTVRAVETLSRTALKDVLATQGESVLDARTGEVLEFAVAVPAENIFYVKAGD